MTELTLRKGLKKHTISMYDDINQLPIERFNKANKYWMLHDNIGSSISDFDTNHYNKFALLADDKEKMLKELNNFRILVFNIMNEVNVEHMSFACLVSAIDGEPRNDLSEDTLKRTLKELSDLGLTQDVLKKKLRSSEKGFMKT